MQFPRLGRASQALNAGSQMQFCVQARLVSQGPWKKDLTSLSPPRFRKTVILRSLRIFGGGPKRGPFPRSYISQEGGSEFLHLLKLPKQNYTHVICQETRFATISPSMFPTLFAKNEHLHWCCQFEARAITKLDQSCPDIAASSYTSSRM